ncbi:MAG TPA: methyltransferase domain-containing protein [Herpetosiphonaceae bacterium]
MNEWTKPERLRAQYRDAGNLDARIALHARYSTNRYGFHRWVLDQIDAPADAAVLDAGCGSARLWSGNAARTPPGWRVTLADFSPGMLADASRTVAGLRPQFALLNADIQSLPLDDALFDVVIANHMLYHVADRPRAYAEIRRVLRPGGLLVAATNSRGTMREYDQLVARFTPDPAARSFQPSESFSLESGGAELADHFAAVELRRYEDALEVTESAPLVAYAASCGMMDPSQLAAMGAFLDAEIAERGPFRISKDVGLFLARRAA